MIRVLLRVLIVSVFLSQLIWWPLRIFLGTEGSWYLFSLVLGIAVCFTVFCEIVGYLIWRHILDSELNR